MRWATSNKQRWLIIGLYGLAWTLMGLISGSKASLLFARYLTAPVSHTMLVLWQVAIWYVWGLFTPLVLALGERFPLERERLWRNALLHAASSLLFSTAHMAFSAFTGQLVLPVDMGRIPFLTVFRNTALQDLHFELMIYWGVLGSGYAFNYYRRYRERELAAAQLERQLIAAQLQALKMQLHPHFLFNTLNTIATMVRRQENEAAVRILAGLGDLLRYALEQVDKQEVPLKQELEFIEQYLEIEQARFRDRLTVRMEIAPETLAAIVPNLILQPLVENAVRHGIAQRAAAGLIEIKAWRDGDKLWLQVRDDGPGLAADSSAVSEQGVGLPNTRARLERLYGQAHSFALHNGAGVTVELALPFTLSAPNQNVYGKAESADRG
jgi:signal transduction histidine kinase